MNEPLLLKFPKGIDNRSREYALAEGTARTLDNFDVTRDGGLRARPGLRTVASGNVHSLYVPNPRFLLLVKDSTLYRMDASETLTSLTAVSGPVHYAVLNEETFWTDGTTVGRVTAAGEATVWGLTTPPSPACTAISSGGLAAGTYQVTMTAVHTATGLESGASASTEVVVATDGGIQVAVPAGSGVTFSLYRTPPNGTQDEFRLAATVAPGATATLDSSTALGKPLDSWGVIKPLPGQALLAHKGRLWCASDRVVWFTSEKSPHWLVPDRGYFWFESAVTMLAGAEDGIYVGTRDRVYFLQGANPETMTQRPVAAEGAAWYTGIEIPYDLFLGQGSIPTRQAAWWTTQGQLAIGKPGGIVIYPLLDRFSAGWVSQGTIAEREYQGMRQLVSVLGRESGPFTSTDVAISEVFANGIVLGSP